MMVVLINVFGIDWSVVVIMVIINGQVSQILIMLRVMKFQVGLFIQLGLVMLIDLSIRLIGLKMGLNMNFYMVIEKRSGSVQGIMRSDLQMVLFLMYLLLQSRLRNRFVRVFSVMFVNMNIYVYLKVLMNLLLESVYLKFFRFMKCMGLIVFWGLQMGKFLSWVFVNVK